MPTDARETEITVRCPSCGRFSFRGKFGRVETMCNDRQCRTSFVATIGPDGTVTIVALRDKRRA